jgi:Ca2+-binding EF-hand superfamily protein
MVNVTGKAKPLMTPDSRKSTLAPRRASRFALRCALALGGALLADAADATPHIEDGALAGDRVESLVLAKAAVAAAIRRTAVADPDLDGVVTPLEAARYYEVRFELLDEDRDRAIRGAEFLRAVAARSLYALDGFAQPRPLAFESVDVDGDGMLTQEEFLRAELLRRTLAESGGSDAGRKAIFDWADANRDGVLSQPEFADAGRQDFSCADRDGDGTVTLWEFYAATRL